MSIAGGADPLEGAETDECTNTRCDGGWVHVTEHYAEQRYPWPETPAEDATEATWAAYAAKVAQVRILRASAAPESTVYPCNLCRPPAQFFAWANGCYAPNHDRRRCKACKERAAEAKK